MRTFERAPADAGHGEPHAAGETAASRRQMLAAALALLVTGSSVSTAGGSTPGEGDLIVLCTEFHESEAAYGRALRVWDTWPEGDTGGEASAEAVCEALSKRHGQVMEAIATRPACTAAGAAAKAKAVAAFFDIDGPPESVSEMMLWSLVRDVAAGIST